MKKKACLAAAVWMGLTAAALASPQIPPDAIEFEGHSYYVYTDKADTWEQAEEYCKSLGGHLASINSDRENQMVYDIMRAFGQSNAYFGLTDAGHEGDWRWANGAPLSYTNWAPGEPNNEYGREHYAMFWQGKPAYQWNDAEFNRGKFQGMNAFICEWDVDPDGSGTETRHRPSRHRPWGHRPHNDKPHTAAPAIPDEKVTESKDVDAVMLLHFDSSTTKDESGRSWSAYQSPTLDSFGAASGKALQLADGSHLSLNTPLTLGGQDFTIDFWVNMSSYSGGYARIFAFYQTENSNSQALLLCRDGSGTHFTTRWDGTTATNPSSKLDHLTHVALVYRHDLGKLATYINGKKDSEITRTIPRTTFKKGLIGKSNYQNDGKMHGTIDEFRIVDGKALYTADFKPSKAAG